LFLEEFIIPVNEEGSVGLPEIPERQEYVDAFMGLKREAIKRMTATFGMRERNLAMSLDKALEAEEAMKHWTSYEPLDIDRSAEGGEEQYQAVLKEARAKASDFQEQHEHHYEKWMATNTSLRKDEQSIEEWTEEAKRRGTKQHEADVDALARAQGAINALKKFMAGLIKKVPAVETVVREMNSGGIDPYEVGDMRGVYLNLLRRYRKGDDLGVATTIMATMRECQGPGQSLVAYMRTIEEFHQTMLRLKVSSVSISDLAAMIAVSGMKEHHRKDFLHLESTLELTMDTIDGGDDADSSDDLGSAVSNGTRRRGDRRPLYRKVKAFVRKEEERKLLIAKFGGSSGHGDRKQGDSAPLTEKEAMKRVREAQRAFATVVTKGNKQACFSFAQTGKCKNGDTCKFEHLVASVTPQAGARRGGSGQGSPAASRGGGGGAGRAPQGTGHVCHIWAESGSCRFGDSCRYLHSTTNAPAAEAAKPQGGRRCREEGRGKLQGTIFRLALCLVRG